MTTPPLDLPALKEIAKAEPSHKWGQWTIENDDWDGFIIFADDGLPGQTIVAKGIHQGSDEGKASATFIAAFDPETVLALLDRAEAAESVYERVEQQALGAEANLEAALKVSRERLARAEAAESALEATRTVLRDTAQVLKGESEPLTVHTWADLARAARDLKGRAKAAEKKVAAVWGVLEHEALVAEVGDEDEQYVVRVSSLQTALDGTS